MAQRSYKSDDSFLEKLAIGAIGTQKVMSNLRAQGHSVIELERGSTGYKIWKSIKIKRVRVPDILCIDSGVRVESRAKTNLVISMSHSDADESRGWDYGLKDNDYIALVVCTKYGDEPVAWRAGDLVQYILVSELRESFEEGHVIKERPKGAEEGFESRLTWPAAIAKSQGKIKLLSRDRVQYSRTIDDRTISLKLSRKDIALKPLVRENEEISPNQILASVVPVKQGIECEQINPEEYYPAMLNSNSISDRYGAAKAFSYISQTIDEQCLTQRLTDGSEHIYIRLECAASLARRGNEQGYLFIEEVLSSTYLEHRLEAIIILGEINTDRSSSVLCRILEDSTQHPEIRGGAAWALGELGFQSSIPRLIRSFRELDNVIRIEAARALRKICESHIIQVLDGFKEASEEERHGIAWALGKTDNWSLDDITRRIDRNDLDMREWAAYIIGMSDQQRILRDIEQLKIQDSELHFAVCVLWKILSSWIYDLREY